MGKYTAKFLENKLRNQLLTEFVQVVDESDECGLKFRAIIVSERFEGKTLLEKHRLVNSALYEELRDIHAFTQKIYTPTEWEKFREQNAISYNHHAPDR